VFFAEDDGALYCDLLGSQRRKNGVSVWAYCLMTNHVNLILVPDREEALGRALGESIGVTRRPSTRGSGVTGHLLKGALRLGGDGRTGAWRRRRATWL
jgi:putative transposase